MCGILKLKEKAQLKGLDIYDIPYKKAPAKKNNVETKEDRKQRFKRRDRKFNENKKEKEEVAEVPTPKESSEDGYSSGAESNDEADDTKSKNETYTDDDYLEEIEVPVRKRENSADDGNDSDDDDNYIHLSDMLDSDDLAETSDEDEEGEDSENVSGDEIDEDIDSDAEENDDVDAEVESDEQDSELDEEESEESDGNEDVPDEGNENEEGNIFFFFIKHCPKLGITLVLCPCICKHSKSKAI